MIGPSVPSGLAIGSLPEGATLADAALRGRVIAVDGRQLVIADESGVAHVALDEAVAVPPLGAWIAARGRWHAGRLDAVAADVLARPSRPFGAADSEWAQAQPDRLVALRIRHAMLRLTRRFFDEQGFTEVETPAVVPSPGLELHLDALEVHGVGASPRYLRTSPEYHMKRLLSAGMSRIYQCCKVYRRGELGQLHQPEFTMLEWYRAFAGMEDVILDTEALVFFVVSSLRGGEATLAARAPGQAELDVTPPWERLTVREAFARHAGIGLDEALRDEATFYRVLAEKVEPQLGRSRPTVLTHYPAAMASLARLSPDDPSVAERFEVYVRGVELCNGFGELVDAAEQRARLEADARARAAQNRPGYPIDERFLAALADGIPPSAGNALGFDRLVMLTLGADRVDEVVAFPSERV